jgi:protein ImuB
VRFPRWPVQRFRHARPALSQQTLVLHAAGRRGQIVMACSPGASRAGVLPGMPLAEAKALLPEAHFAAHEPRADREALGRLAEWCQQFSPDVAVDEAEQPASLFLDVTGSGVFFGSEQVLARKVVDDLGRYGYWARVAIADTVGAARALAHHVGRPTQSAAPGPVIVPPAGQEAALRPLPVEALRLSPAVTQMLHRLDMRRVGQLLDLPRAALPSRFGKEILLRIDQALGRVPELLTPVPIPEPVEASWSFEPTTDDRQVIVALCEHLLEQIMERLRSRLRGIRRLECSLRTSGGETMPVSVGLLQPSASVPHLIGLVRLHCERLRIDGEVSTLVVRVPEMVPLEFAQAQLFEDEPEKERWRAFPGLIEQLSNRLGEKAVLRPRVLPDAQPECACRFDPWLGQDVSAASKANDSAENKEVPLRPSCLKYQPVAVRVVSPAPDGPPLRFVWQEQCHVIAHSWGPERIETGWWRGCDIHRDYYLVESTVGRRFWLFRALRDGNWFLHGTFA